jgi:hypothetical protein
MGDDTPRPTRRTVLRTTGVALGTGLAATGTAAAACYQYDTATLLYDYKLLENTEYGDCAGDAVGPIEEAGTEFEVYEVCEDLEGKYVKVIPPETFEYRWIETDAVECS